MNFTPNNLEQLQESPFKPLAFLINKFGRRLEDGSILISLDRPIMPNPNLTQWRLLPFNEGDNIADLSWDLFKLHGNQYKTGVEVFDKLRAHLGLCETATLDQVL